MASPQSSSFAAGSLRTMWGGGRTITSRPPELPEILAVADRIIVMSEGRKTAEFTRAEANEENIMKAALPRN